MVFLMLIRRQNEKENGNLEEGKLFQMRREKKKIQRQGKLGQEDRKEERILRSETSGRN